MNFYHDYCAASRSIHVLLLVFLLSLVRKEERVLMGHVDLFCVQFLRLWVTGVRDERGKWSCSEVRSCHCICDPDICFLVSWDRALHVQHVVLVVDPIDLSDKE